MESREEIEASVRAEYARAKNKFYKNPIFAAQAGLVVGFLIGWVVLLTSSER